MSWMIEGTLLWSALIWLYSRKLNWVRMSSFLLIITNCIAYAVVFQCGAYFEAQSAIVSLVTSSRVYYWDNLTAVMSALNLFATVLTACYQLYHMNEETSDQVGLLWMTFSCVQGIFCCQHAILFYVFFELSIIPLCLWLLHFPTKEAAFTTKQFVLYTCLGSSFLLIGLVICYLGINGESWIFKNLAKALVPGALTPFLSFCFLIPFLIKLPLWPVHGWLPLAHTQAPTEGSVILASVVLKVGGYGLLRIIPLMGSNIAQIWSPTLIILGLISLLTMSLSAYKQTDWKRLIAYSSIVHMAWVVIGIGLLIGHSSISNIVYKGIVFQMISHGLISIALFFIVGMLSHRTNTREISAYRGMAKVIPTFTKYITFFMLANAALPGTSGFVGEFMILQGLYQYSQVLAFIACLSLVTSMLFNLQYFIPFLHDDPSQERQHCGIADCQKSEHRVLAPLALGILYLGVFPQGFFSFFTL